MQRILEKELSGYEVWAFGSRVHGKRLKPFSDLDLVIVKPAPSNQQIMQLMDVFSESDLPFKVDIIDWNSIDKDFQKIIKDQYEPITPLSPNVLN